MSEWTLFWPEIQVQWWWQQEQVNEMQIAKYYILDEFMIFKNESFLKLSNLLLKITRIQDEYIGVKYL